MGRPKSKFESLMNKKKKRRKAKLAPESAEATTSTAEENEAEPGEVHTSLCSTNGYSVGIPSQPDNDIEVRGNKKVSRKPRTSRAMPVSMRVSFICIKALLLVAQCLIYWLTKERSVEW